MNAIVATRHLEDCKKLLKQAQDNSAFSKAAFEELVARQSLGADVSAAQVTKARRERDEAVAALEAAEIALRAAASNAVQAQEAARAESEAADWLEVEKLGASFEQMVCTMSAALKDLDASAARLFKVAAEIEERSPRAKQRPDVTDLAGARLRARLQRSIELTLSSAYGASSEARYAFKGFEPTMTSSLKFFTDRNYVG